MNRYLYIVVAILSLSLCSCENSFNDSKVCPQIVGRWALVEADGSVNKYIEFKEGNLTEYHVKMLSSVILYENGILRGCTADDFIETVRSHYSISNSVVITTSVGYSGDISAGDKMLRINDVEYRYIEDFEPSFSRTIEVDLKDDITVGFSETAVSIPYKVLSAPEGTIVSVTWSGSLEYADFVITTNNISFKVAASDVTRSSSIILSCPGAQNVEVVVNQKCDQPERCIYYTTTDGQKLSIPVSQIDYSNPLTEHIFVDGLGTIIFSKPLQHISAKSFKGCSTLSSITIPDSVTSIGDWAFDDCGSLTSVIIPDSVTTIGLYAFVDCSSLAKITIPDSVTLIRESTFEGCGSLTSVIIPDGVTEIGSSAFMGCSGLTKITIPDSVTKIGRAIFCRCDSLTSVTIGNGVKTIGDSAFKSCVSMTDITIGDSVTTIGNYAFDSCSSLTSVTIPDSVTTIGTHAFYCCSSLEEVYISDLSAWCRIDFGSTNANPLCYGAKLYINNTELTELTIPSDVSEIKQHTFEGCSFINVIIHDGVTSIGKYAFHGCTGELIVNCNIPSSSRNDYGAFYGSKFTKVTIGDSVTTIGKHAFYDCSSLTSVTIPDSVTTIGRAAFSNCSSLTSVTIPDSVTTIGRAAFYDCSSLTSVTIGDSVTTIEDRAFSACGLLTSVYCKALTPPTGGYYMFNGNASGRKIYVPMGSVYAYKTALHWMDYADDIVGYDF